MTRRRAGTLITVLLLLIGLVAPVYAADTLTVWTSWGVVNDFVNQAGKDFSRTHPNYKVESTLFPQRALEAKIATALPAGSGADLIVINTVSLWEYWDEKFLAPVPKPHAEWARQVFARSALDDLTDYKEQMAGLPFIYYVESMFYNADHLSAAGLPHSPATVDEMLTYAKRLTVIENGVVKRQGINLRLGGGGHGIAEKFWAQAMVPYGVEPLVRAGNGWRAGYNTPQAVEALSVYLRALHRDRSATFDLKGDAEGFALGLGSMFQRESWVISYLAQNKAPVRYVTALMPKGPKNWGTIAGTLGVVVPAASKHKEAAFELAKFLNSPENSMRLTETTGWQTARKDVDYAPLYPKMPGLKTFVDSLKTPGYTVYGYPRIAPVLEIMTRFSERLAAAFQNKQLIDNRTAIERLLAQSAEETNKILADRGLLGR